MKKLNIKTIVRHLSRETLVPIKEFFYINFYLYHLKFPLLVLKIQLYTWI
jgi:hypothetical protein